MTLDTLDVTTNEPNEETDNFARDEFGDIAEHFANALLGDEERARYMSISETLGALISTVKVWESVHLKITSKLWSWEPAFWQCPTSRGSCLKKIQYIKEDLAVTRSGGRLQQQRRQRQQQRRRLNPIICHI